MNITRVYAVLSLALALVFFCAESARADQYYAFVEVLCQPDQKTVELMIQPNVSRETPEPLLQKNRKGNAHGVYSFDVLALGKQKISCSISQNIEVTFQAHKSEIHPANDNISVTLNGQKTPIRFSNLPFRASIKFVDANSYTVDACSLELPEQERCTHKIIVDGRSALSK